MDRDLYLYPTVRVDLTLDFFSRRSISNERKIVEHLTSPRCREWVKERRERNRAFSLRAPARKTSYFVIDRASIIFFSQRDRSSASGLSVNGSGIRVGSLVYRPPPSYSSDLRRSRSVILPRTVSLTICDCRPIRPAPLTRPGVYGYLRSSPPPFTPRNGGGAAP